MIFVVIDSSILKQDLTFTAFFYQLLKVLVDSQAIQIVLPEIVIDECQSEIKKKIEKLCASLEQDCSETFKFLSKTNNIKDTIKLKDAIISEVSVLRTESEASMRRFLKDYKVKKVEYSKGITETALKLYFAGEGPVKEVKNRSDLPDAFIYAAIKKIEINHTPLHFICADNHLRECVSKIKSINTHQRIDEFFEHDDIKAHLRSEEDSYDTPTRKFGRENRGQINEIISSKLFYLLKEKHFSDSLIKERNIYRILEIITVDYCEFTCWGASKTKSNDIAFHGNAIVLARLIIYKYNTLSNRHEKDKESIEKVIIDGTIYGILNEGPITLEKLANAKYFEDYWSTIQLY